MERPLFVCPVCQKDLRQAALVLGDGEEVMRVHRKHHLEMFVLKAEKILWQHENLTPELKALSEEAQKLCS